MESSIKGVHEANKLREALVEYFKVNEHDKPGTSFWTKSQLFEGVQANQIDKICIFSLKKLYSKFASLKDIAVYNMKSAKSLQK